MNSTLKKNLNSNNQSLSSLNSGSVVTKVSQVNNITSGGYNSQVIKNQYQNQYSKASNKQHETSGNMQFYQSKLMFKDVKGAKLLNPNS